MTHGIITSQTIQHNEQLLFLTSYIKTIKTDFKPSAKHYLMNQLNQ